MELTVDGKVKTLLKRDDLCPICDKPVGEHCFSWNLFHGEATTRCGAVWQTKDYHIDNPSPEQVKLLELLGNGAQKDNYFEFKMFPHYVQPIRKAMAELGEHSITDEVVKLAKKYLPDEDA